MRVGRAFVAVLLLAALPMAARAAPLRTQMAAQRISVQVSRRGGTAVIIKDGLKARVLSSALQWEYVQSSTVSVPFLNLLFFGIPNTKLTVLVDRTSPLTQETAEGYVLRVPLLKKSNLFLVTIVSPNGSFEDWIVDLRVALTESSVYVDETCKDYLFKIRELRAPSPNLLYVGCLGGVSHGELSLEILWSDLEKMEYRGQTISAEGEGIVTVPLEPKHVSSSDVTGTSRAGERSVFRIDYEPEQAPPWELKAGLAFFHTSFQQSNFPSTFSQASTAFIGEFRYRPEDVRLSLLVRGFGSLLSFSQTLNPDLGYQESATTYFVDGELRYSVYEGSGWHVDPLIGGWMFFMSVASRGFGIQRIIDPIVGIAVRKDFARRNSLELTARLVPLQTVFNPFAFQSSQSYLELDATYSRRIGLSTKLFGTFSFGSLNYGPEGLAQTSGTYLVLGGGLGW
jgi:hypothetical protein